MKLKKFLFSFFLFIIFAMLLIPSSTLPKIDGLIEDYEIIEPSVIYDCKGREIDKIYKENRELCAIEEVPYKLINAFLSLEDQWFFYHRGFNPIRILKALFFDIFTFTKAQGASTITQQLAKNAFLDNSKTFSRKIKEALITLQIERKYTKEEILEKYLNEIYFGRGIYGVKTAAKAFFKKSLKKLTLSEMAFLASIPKIPNADSSRLNSRRRYVLTQMFKYSFINENEYKENIDKNIELKKFYYINKLPSFTDIVVNKISSIFTHKQLKEGGLKIFTTLDMDCQEQAQKAFDSNEFLSKNPELEGALVSLDPFTGDVKAIIAGRKFLSGYYNRATRSQRQPGSAFKPLVFLGAILDGYSLNTIVEDSPLKFGEWQPKNYDLAFMGNITLMESLYFSRNTTCIKLLKNVGISKVIKLSHDLGIESDIPYNLTIALGTFSTNALEIANSYCTIVNGGYKVKPNFIETIEDKYENVIFSNKSLPFRMCDEKAIALVLHTLKNSLRKSSEMRLGKIKNVEKGGKSGTSSNFRDAWFCAFTPDLVTAVYLGYDDNRPIGEGAFGGKIAAPIWKNYIENLLELGYEPGKFEFEERLIQNCSLKYRNLDSKTGLLNKDGKKFLIRREHVPIENFEKYENGLNFITD